MPNAGEHKVRPYKIVTPYRRMIIRPYKLQQAPLPPEGGGWEGGRSAIFRRNSTGPGTSLALPPP